jgi:hypothetical protein
VLTVDRFGGNESWTVEREKSRANVVWFGGALVEKAGNSLAVEVIKLPVELILLTFKVVLEELVCVELLKVVVNVVVLEGREACFEVLVVV